MIPRRVTGKFSVRIVPNQTPELVEKIVIDYLERYFDSKMVLGEVLLDQLVKVRLD